jgi:hypothetical protein
MVGGLCVSFVVKSTRWKKVSGNEIQLLDRRIACGTTAPQIRRERKLFLQSIKFEKARML